MKDTIALPSMRQAGAVRAESYDEGANTVEVCWTTGASVRRMSWMDGPYDEELVIETDAIRLGRLNAGAPLLDTHDSYALSSVIGSVVPGSARIDKGRGLATVKLSAAPGDADTVQKIRDGIIRNISVGYIRHRIEKIEADDGSVPVWRVTDWEPMEISAVPIPADPGAQVRSEAADPPQALYPCVIVRAGANPAAPAASTQENDTMTTPRASAPAAADAGAQAPVVQPITPTAHPPVDADAIRMKAIEQERARIADITALGERHGVRDFAMEHAKLNTPVAEFRTLLLDKLAERSRAEAPRNPAPPAATVSGEERADAERGHAIEIALLHRYDSAAFAEDFAKCPQARQYRGMSIIEMAKECLAARNVATRGMSKLEVADAALAMRSPGHRDIVIRSSIGGLMSTSDFPNILQNVINKTLRQAYAANPQTFKPIVRVVTVPDFKQVSRVQLGDAPQLEKVNEHGKFKTGGMGEMAEKYSIATYGKIVGVTRQVIVNDDLDAFTRLPRAFGIQAANLESDIVWFQILNNAAMNDSVALFNSAHKNQAASAGAIAVATVGAARQAMATQVGLDGKTLTFVELRNLIVPKALQTSTEQFFTAIYPATAANALPESLRSRSIISEPRLDAGVTLDGVTAAGSTSIWYGAGDVNQIDIIELAYLEGQEGVFTESRMGFDVDGMEVKVRLDVGAKVIDWRGLYRNS